jgi:hypothetical protein
MGPVHACSIPSDGESWRVLSSQDTTDVIYAEDEEVFRETAVRELLKLGFLRPVIRWMPGMG